MTKLEHSVSIRGARTLSPLRPIALHPRFLPNRPCALHAPNKTSGASLCLCHRSDKIISLSLPPLYPLCSIKLLTPIALLEFQHIYTLIHVLKHEYESPWSVHSILVGKVVSTTGVLILICIIRFD